MRKKRVSFLAHKKKERVSFFAKKRKGSAYAWLVVLVSMFMITIVYVFMSQPVADIIPAAKEDITNLTNSTTRTNILETFDTIDAVWKYWPLLLFFGLVLWAIVYSTRKEPEYAGGY